jgi:hypothetical protein
LWLNVGVARFASLPPLYSSISLCLVARFASLPPVALLLRVPASLYLSMPLSPYLSMPLCLYLSMPLSLYASVAYAQVPMRKTCSIEQSVIRVSEFARPAMRVNQHA